MGPDLVGRRSDARLGKDNITQQKLSGSPFLAP